MFGFFKSIPGMFSLSLPVKITMVLCGVSAMFFALGYALKPVAEIVDELHESGSENGSDSDSTDPDKEELDVLKEKLIEAVEAMDLAENKKHPPHHHHHRKD